MDYRVSHVIALMRSNIRTDMDLTRMAESVSLTPEHLCWIFKAETGESPGRYFKKIRMQEAEKLVVNTFLSVKEIMTVVGINDESHFVRDFKSFYGLSPTQYRLRKRDNVEGEGVGSAAGVNNG
jgi:transcriptional regulator GlxA family with amidase domain